ncbi:MAG: hypothetical protein H6709_06975 [Kofleriaceae bacterium]|nr:hypothetical protein [Kofleriaceae bacterium]
MTTPRARPRPRRHRGGRGATIALGAVVALVAVASAPRPAAAVQIESPATAPCHEELTVAAVVAAGFPDRDVAPAPTEDQARAMDDLTFRLPRRDVWTLALLIGVRSNDLRGFSPIDVSALVSVHDDPDDQQAHCLRGPDDDEPGGDLGALAACRAFILDELAAGGLLDDDLDLAATEAVEVFLAFRGRIALDLPRFAYRLGRALHAVEDGYSHTFRDPGGGEVTHVLNWIDHADGHGDAGRDGYHHVGALDDCRRDDGRTRRRVQRATDAAAALVAAIGDPAPGGARGSRPRSTPRWRRAPDATPATATATPRSSTRRPRTAARSPAARARS